MSLKYYFLVLGLVIAGLCALDAVHADQAQPVKHKTAVKRASKAKARKKPAKSAKRAVKAGKKISAAKPKTASGELQTDVKFDDSVLHGQYQTPEEALARVENEKGLDDLLGVRKHFKDRLATASEQE